MRKFRIDAKPIDLSKAKQLHWEQGLSIRAIAKMFNVDHANLLARFKRFSIPIRPRKEALKLQPERKAIGGISKSSAGYLVFSKRDAKRYLHRLIADKILGRPLKRNEVVHHWDQNRLNNEHSNLLICTNEYHSWLHAKMQNFRIGKNKM